MSRINIPHKLFKNKTSLQIQNFKLQPYNSQRVSTRWLRTTSAFHSPKYWNGLYYHSRNNFSTKKDYYDLLGVNKDASEQDIKKAFYKMAKQWHPDANKAPEAKDKFSEINEAYQVLSNKEKRAHYDKFGFAANQQFGSADFSNFANMGLNDLFSNLFSGFGRMQDGVHDERLGVGDDLKVEIPLSFMEAVNGTKKEIVVQRYDECSSCNSSGIEPGTKQKTCKQCNGKGMSMHRHSMLVFQQTCWECGGTGKVFDHCRKCHAHGIITSNFKTDIQIPAGVDDGTRIVLHHQGHAGPKKGGRGNIYIFCRVSPHQHFERHGGDIHVAVDVPMHIALLGGTVTVPTLTGEAEVRIKPGTQHDHKEVMRSKGITEYETKRTGHQYLHFNLVIPKNLTEKQKQLMEEFAKIEESKKQRN